MNIFYIFNLNVSEHFGISYKKWMYTCVRMYVYIYRLPKYETYIILSIYNKNNDIDSTVYTALFSKKKIT